MKKEFIEFLDTKLQEEKVKLDLVPHNGSINNFSERLNIFNSGIKNLNDEFVAKANGILLNQVDDLITKDELLQLSKEKIENYISYFKGK